MPKNPLEGSGPSPLRSGREAKHSASRAKRFKAHALAACVTLGLIVAASLAGKAQTFTTLYSFCSQGGVYCTDGYEPFAGLVQGSDGNFYGTTLGGGANGGGTVFKITPSGTLTTLYSFCSQSGCTDGYYLYAGLVQGSDGNFYGTTAGGGANGGGEVFKITPSGTLTTLYSFCSQGGVYCTDGEYPFARLVQGSDGNFYGTTESGGANREGTVFKITPNGTLTTLYSFCSQSGCTDGYGPRAGLVQDSDGNFYGTTVHGGALVDDLYGTVFKITPSGTLTTLHSFCSQGGCTDGEFPYAGLVQGSDGNFYGTTYSGGNGYGTVFQITPSGTLTTLYSFCSQSGCTDGYCPYGGLLQGSDGNFYGTTEYGGANGKTDYGTVFKITPSGTLTTLYSFCSQSGCTDGYDPFAGLVQGSDGNFYGTTYGYLDQGEANGNSGTVFKLVVFPVVMPSPTSLRFGNQNVGTTSASQPVTLSNTGTATLTIASIAASGDFSQTNTCGSSVAASGSCTISVTLTPTATGTRSGTLTITDNASGSPQSLSLTGTGVAAAPVAGVSTSSLTFSGQLLGTTSAAQPVTLSNTGNVALTLTSISISGDFAQTNNCPGSLAAGAGCTISVTFTPTAPGNRTGALTLTDNAANSPQTVSLTGTGEDFTLVAASGHSLSATVPPGQAAIYTLTVDGEGGFNQSVTLSCGGFPTESTCVASPSSVAPGSNFTVIVTTTAPSAIAPRTLPQPRLPGPQALLVLAVLLACSAWSIRASRQGRASWRTVFLPLAAGLLLALALAGCGGSAANINYGTPAGTYTVTVTGTVGSGSTALTHSVTLTLKVS